MRHRGQGNRGSAAKVLGAKASDEGAERIGNDAKRRDPRGFRLVHEIRLEQFRYQDRAVTLGQSYGDLAGVRRQARQDLQNSEWSNETLRLARSNGYLLTEVDHEFSFASFTLISLSLSCASSAFRYTIGQSAQEAIGISPFWHPVLRAITSRRHLPRRILAKKVAGFCLSIEWN